MFIDELSYFNIESNISIWERVNVLDLHPDCTLESPEGVKKKKNTDASVPFPETDAVVWYGAWAKKYF